MYRTYHHMYYKKLNEDDISDSAAQINDFKNYLEDGKELDRALDEIYPLSYFGAPTDYLLIKGTKSLLDEFDKIRAEKLDITESLKNIEYIGLNDKEQIILNFVNDRMSASGIYDFTYDFLDDFFKMGKYATHCISKGYNDLVKENLLELFSLQGEDTKQFRLLMKGDKLFLRGLTSLGYMNYDNNVVLYLTILFLDKYAKHNNVSYKIDEAEISDSHLRIFLSEETPLKVEGLGTIYFGLVIKNDEIREGKFSLEMKYSIYDEKGHYVFAGMPELEDSIFSIIHTTGIEKLSQNLTNIDNILKLQRSMIPLITGIKHAGNLNDETIEFLFDKITYARQTLRPEIRKNILGLFDANIINNTITLIEAFGRISEIDCDFDERLFIQSLYHKVIKRVLRK